MSFVFFFNDTATTEIYTLSLHDALPIFHWCSAKAQGRQRAQAQAQAVVLGRAPEQAQWRAGRSGVPVVAGQAWLQIGRGKGRNPGTPKSPMAAFSLKKKRQGNIRSNTST